jgi:hypothetical protein
MSAYAVSVPEAIREILTNNPVYLQALELGIANFTAIAERIKPAVEKLIDSKVNLNTIVVAIKRLADTLEEKRQQENEQMKMTRRSTIPRAKMSLTGSIIDIDFQKESNNYYDEIFEDILDKFLDEYNHCNLFHTDNHFTLLAEDADKIRNNLANAIEKFDGKISEGLSKITITLNNGDDQNPYRLISLVSNILYNYQIQIHSAFFTSTEIILILSDEDAAKAYELIRMKIEG